MEENGVSVYIYIYIYMEWYMYIFIYYPKMYANMYIYIIYIIQRYMPMKASDDQR